jgi:hypothetical protein
VPLPLRREELLERVAEVRHTELPQLFPGGRVPTLGIYGTPAEPKWGAFESMSTELRDAMNRPGAEPVHSFVVAPSADLNLYVATRTWIKPGGRQVVRDLFIFSTGPVVERYVAMYLSGTPSMLVGNPFHEDITKLDPLVRDFLGYGPGHRVPGHHESVADALASVSLAPEMKREIEAAVDRMAKHPGPGRITR